MAAFGAYRIPELTRYALWYDELFSLSLAQRGWGDLLAGAVADRTNPPLFYILLKAWIGIGGESVAWMRLLPCAFGTLVAVPMVALARRVARAMAGGDATDAGAELVLPFTIALVAVAAASPLAVFLSNELRAYSLLLLLSATWLLAYFRVAESAEWLAPGAAAADGDAPSWRGQAFGEHRRRVAQLTMVAVLLAYTHYFGWLLIAATLGAALFWRRSALAGVIVAAGVAGLAFLPWATAVAVNAARVARPLANVAWVTPPRPVDVPVFYDALVARVLTPDTAWVGGMLLAALGGGLALWLRRAPRGSPPRRVAAELALLALMPVAVAYVASVVTSQSAFVPRYLMVAAPAWWLLVALAAMALGSATARGRAMELDSHRWGAAVALAAFTLVAGALREVRGGEKIPWDAVVRAIAADRVAHPNAEAGPGGAQATGAAPGRAPDGTIYSLEGFTALPAAYYAATLRTGLRVRPVTSLDSMVAPAWLVVRASPPTATAALGAGFTPRGVTLTAVYEASVPSHAIVAYRVGRQPQ
ncbi:MAG: hypothetical protein U9Q74_15815 [Gemmatimonadota bacterium]|nr:hypothetical protein [Gemmatimonadota bacterium]